VSSGTTDLFDVEDSLSHSKRQHDTRTLGIQLTRRRQKDAADIPMCGVPASTLDATTARLLAAGHKVAVSDKATEDGGDRQLRLLTPGTSVDAAVLAADRANNLTVAFAEGEAVAFAWIDLSTGEAGPGWPRWRAVGQLWPASRRRKSWWHSGRTDRARSRSRCGVPASHSSGLSCDNPLREAAKTVIVEEVERLHWRLWNGKATNARIDIDRILAVMHHFKGETGTRRSNAPSRKLWTTLHALDGYLTGQSDCLVNCSERHRAGLRVGIAITEGTANFLVNRRMNKSQQMRWSRRAADLLLQVRCAVYNGTIGSDFGQRFRPSTIRTHQWP
jgi:hypothetical protein